MRYKGALSIGPDLLRSRLTLGRHLARWHRYRPSAGTILLQLLHHRLSATVYVQWPRLTGSLGPSCPVFLARTPLRRLVSVACTYGTAAARRTCQHRSSRTCPLLTQSAQMAPPSSSSAAGGVVQAPRSPVEEALLDGLRQQAAPVQEAALPSQGASLCIASSWRRASLRPPVGSRKAP